MFIVPGEVDFPYAAKHYNERGNRFIAEALHRTLMARPSISQALFDASQR